MTNAAAIQSMKEIRAERGFTQQSLAVEMGVALSTIRHWESRFRTPNTPTRRQLAHTLGVPVEIVDGWFAKEVAA